MEKRNEEKKEKKKKKGRWLTSHQALCTLICSIRKRTHSQQGRTHKPFISAIVAVRCWREERKRKRESRFLGGTQRVPWVRVTKLHLDFSDHRTERLTDRLQSLFSSFSRASLPLLMLVFQSIQVAYFWSSNTSGTLTSIVTVYTEGEEEKKRKEKKTATTTVNRSKNLHPMILPTDPFKLIYSIEIYI